MCATTSTARPDQAEVIAYDGGRVAVAAVPGAGKTYVLKELAARLIEEKKAAPNQLLMLTYMRTGAMNLRERIQTELAARGRSASGLRVMTIHAFCHQLLQRHGAHLLGNGRTLISQGEQRMRLVRGLELYLSEDGHEEAWLQNWNTRERVTQDSDKFFQAQGWSLEAAAGTISAAKAYRLPMAKAAELVRQLGFHEVAFVAEYYDREMQQQEQLDYDDLISLSIRLFEEDPALLQNFQKKFRYVLEDEAQDSTYTQQLLVEMLTRESGNLMRVGDTNQAILSTFTFNDPQYFRDFLHSARRLPLQQSGRSARRIQEMANDLVAIGLRHPEAARVNAFEAQQLQPSSSGQQNPDDVPGAIKFWVSEKIADQDERIAAAVLKYLAARAPEPGQPPSVGILTTSNKRASEIGKRLRSLGIDVWMPGESEVATEEVLLVLAEVFRFLCLKNKQQESMPLILSILKRLQALHDHPLDDAESLTAWCRQATLSSIPFIYPDLPAALGGSPLPRRPETVTERDYLALLNLGEVLRDLLSLRHRPVVELIAWSCDRLFPDPATQLAGHQLAMMLRREYFRHPDMDLDQAVDFVEALCRQKRAGILKSDAGDDAVTAPVMVATVHKSKGMEFDTVFIADLTPRGYPWEVLEKVDGYAIDANRRRIAIRAIEAHGDGKPWSPEGVVRQAAYDEVGEKLRLLYVALTRAKRCLVLSTTTAKEGGWNPRPLGWPTHVQMLKQAFGRPEPDGR
jgi:DNA helicase-2/ATP-dependent DNA helicase PcrA